MCVNCFVFLSCSQLNQKLRERTEGAQNDTTQAITEPQPVQPSVSIALHIQYISVSCHTSLYQNTHDNLSRILHLVLSKKHPKCCVSSSYCWFCCTLPTCTLQAQLLLVNTVRLRVASLLCQQGCLIISRKYRHHNPFSCLSSSSTVGLIPLLVLPFSISLSFSISCPSSSLTVSYSLVLETCSCKFPPFLCSLPLSLHPSSVFIKFITKYLMVRCVFFPPYADVRMLVCITS